MGGRGGASGFKNNNTFQSISLDGMTGTDKQKSYAQDLLDAMKQTAELNGIAGFHQLDNSLIRRQVSKDDAEKVQQEYRIMKEIIETQKTYVEVINILKNKSHQQ